jgi:hypothetical protein
MTQTNLSDRQQKWFASVRASLERDTGKSIDDWVAIAKTCPETAHRARLKWFKETHGLLQNRASQVLDAAFPPAMGWNDAEALIDALWTDPASRAIYDAVDAAALALPGAIRTARKGYTAWTRKVQFAALRPVKGGGATLGLAVKPDFDARLEPPRSESWSERLTARMPVERDTDISAPLRQAWERS